MISLLLAAMSLQPADSDLMINLCNETPVSVAYSVSFSAASGMDVQRGWFTVAPGDCLEGRIGATAGGIAHVHARSGSWVWPVEDASPRSSVRCVPPASHEMAARTPPCGGSMREEVHASTALERSGRRYVLNYSVSCSDLDDDASLCRSARPGLDGYAEVIREARICNVTDQAVLVGELTGQPRSQARVETWHQIEAGQCRAVFRDFRPAGDYYFLTPLGDVEGGDVFSTGSDAYCVTPGESGLPESDARPAPGPRCPSGTQVYVLRTAVYGSMTSLFEITVN